MYAAQRLCDRVYGQRKACYERGYCSWKFSRVVFLLLLTVVALNTCAGRVWTKFGIVQGLLSRSTRGRLVVHYLGIPYAEPPLGDLRFRSPQPWRRTWNDTFFATTNAEKCTQLNEKLKTEGSEDCLYLNIFVPVMSEKREASSKLPVMMFVHGEQFAKGATNSSVYAPEYLMDQDLILVTVNYRLNVFGFFSTGNRVSPGNYGIKDILMALKWVKQNIENFYGDPNSVTLWGHGAGAAAVHALALTNKTEGLFNRYIMQSGCILSNAHLNSRQNIRMASLRAARILGCLPPRPRTNTEPVTENSSNEISTTGENDESSEEIYVINDDYDQQEDQGIVKCMRSVDAREIVEVLKFFNDWRGNPCCPFGPTIEDDSEDAIITMHPLMAIKNRLLRDIPCIMGINKGDGLVKTTDILVKPEVQCELLINFKDYLLYLLEYHHQVSNASDFFNAIGDFYFGKHRFIEDILHSITDLVTDAIYAWPQYEILKRQSEVMNSSIYFYIFSYEGTFSHTFKYNSSIRHFFPGVGHGDDLNYLIPLLNRKFKDEMQHNTEKDITMINIMTEMWASFASKGVPSAWRVTSWPDYKKSHEFLRFGIGKEPDIVVESDFLSERMEFWDELTKNFTSNEMEENYNIKQNEESSISATNKYDKPVTYLLILFVMFIS